MTTVLITGIAGFVGSHLVEFLLRDSTIKVVGILHPEHEIQHLEEHPRVVVHREDILKERKLTRLVRSIAPQRVYHLAGMAHVHESWKDRKRTIETNFVGSLHLLEACRTLPEFPRVLLVGSADCYGIVPEAQQPILESCPLVPSSPYAVSKMAQEILGMQYAKAENLPVFLSRSFNHTGPYQKETFVCSSFAKQIAMAEMVDELPVIRVGNLTARRDFSDVRDVVRAYHAILEQGVPGEPYNVCSGKAISIREVLDILLSRSSRRFEVEIDSEKFRPVDMPLLLGSAEKLRSETGWSPEHEIEITLGDLLDFWRSRLRSGAAVS